MTVSFASFTSSIFERTLSSCLRQLGLQHRMFDDMQILIRQIRRPPAVFDLTNAQFEQIVIVFKVGHTSPGSSIAEQSCSD
jgi:hypothetical protein